MKRRPGGVGLSSGSAPVNSVPQRSLCPCEADALANHALLLQSPPVTPRPASRATAQRPPHAASERESRVSPGAAAPRRCRRPAHRGTTQDESVLLHDRAAPRWPRRAPGARPRRCTRHGAGGARRAAWRRRRGTARRRSWRSPRGARVSSPHVFRRCPGCLRGASRCAALTACGGAPLLLRHPVQAAPARGRSRRSRRAPPSSRAARAEMSAAQDNAAGAVAAPAATAAATAAPVRRLRRRPPLLASIALLTTAACAAPRPGAAAAAPMCYHTAACDHACAPPWHCSVDAFGDACGSSTAEPPGVYACMRADGRVDTSAGAPCYEYSGCNGACAALPGTSCMQHAESTRALLRLLFSPSLLSPARTLACATLLAHFLRADCAATARAPARPPARRLRANRTPV
jgi:hypothetical protein